MPSDIIRLFDSAVTASRDRSARRGQIGKINPTGNPTIDVPGTNGRLIYVRLGDGSDGVIQAVPKNVPRRAHEYVKVFQEDGQYVAELDTSAIGNGTGGSAPVAPHTHRRFSGNEYVTEAELFAPGLVLPSSGLTVSIGSFRYPNATSGETYPGGTLDLTSVMPATAGTWSWLVVGVDPATNTAVAVAGAEFASQALLTIDEIDNVAFDGYIPLAAIQANEADTSLNNISRYHDARTWFTPSNLTDQGLFVRLDDTDWIDLTDAGETALHIHDSRYYTEAETDALIAAADGGDLAAHAALTEAHGATGAVVGTTNAQTLSQKTFSDVITANAGITFGDETLGTYDEGTWTPIVDAVTTPPTVAYTLQAGYYTQIGNMVSVSFRITINTISGGSGQLRIGGLPVTVADLGFGMPAVAQFRGVNLSGVPSTVGLNFIGNTTTMSLVTTIDDAVFVIEDIGVLAAGDAIIGNGWYQAA